MYEVVKNTNDWLKDYREQTYSEDLQKKLIKGLFEEHNKFSQQKTFKKILDEITDITEKQKNQILKKIDDRTINILERMGKKCIVYTLDPVTKEIEDIGGSSLLRNLDTGLFESNLILDQFGLIFSGMMDNSGASVASLVQDDGNVTRTLDVNFGVNPFLGGEVLKGRFGSTAPALLRSNFKITTNLVTAPENTYIVATGPGYNVANQVIYNIDVIMGATETINEAGTFMTGFAHGGAGPYTFMLTDDVVGPIAAPIGKLERAAYAWQL